jgi:hypothetical protein
LPDSDRLDSGDVYLQSAPFYRNAERLVDEALRIAAVPANALARIRPPLPDIQLFPSRFGYPEYEERQAGIDAVLNMGYAYANRREDISGGPSEIDAAARNAGSSYFGW